MYFSFCLPNSGVPEYYALLAAHHGGDDTVDVLWFRSSKRKSISSLAVLPAGSAGAELRA